MPDVFDDVAERHPRLAGVVESLRQAADLIAACFDDRGQLLVCGNGGSAADAEHIVGELMKGMSSPRRLDPAARRKLERAAPGGFGSYLAEQLEVGFGAICLSSQSALVTAVANDTAGDMIFAQQVYAYGRPGDVLWALSTSGRSRNVLLAAATAKAVGMGVIAFTGASGEQLGALADVWVPVAAEATRDVQELHLPALHAVCEFLDGRGIRSGR